ncbi:MAG: potassium channel family protein [Bythopirellula sp.]|nr:potassium channel family protein [Bythopirellula sp.]
MHPLANLFRQWRYLFLLGALLLLLVIQPMISGFGTAGWLFDIMLALVMVMLVLVLTRDKGWRVIACVLCVPAATLSIGSHFLNPSAQQICLFAGHAIGALFFIAVTGKIIQSIFMSREISLDSIFGAICGYLLLGVAWGLMYTMLHTFNSESFQFDAAIGRQIEQGDNSRHVFIYFSFVTLTTIGYGDISPLSTPPRTLAWVKAVTGQLYLAVLIAGLMSALIATKRN